MEPIDAVVLAAGRLPEPEAQRAGAQIKALVRVGETTPLEAVLTALRASNFVRRVNVIAPAAVHTTSSLVDLWIDEHQTGEDNVLAGVGSMQTRRGLISASDIPFVRSEDIDDFLSRVPADADFAYPVYERTEFLRAFPGGRTQFARVGRSSYTGGSMCLLNVELALRHGDLIRRGFAARKSQLALASLLGIGGLVRFATGQLRIEDVEQRLGQLTGGRAIAIRGAHPALAMDCDSALDVEYVRQHNAHGQL